MASYLFLEHGIWPEETIKRSGMEKLFMIGCLEHRAEEHDKLETMRQEDMNRIKQSRVSQQQPPAFSRRRR